MKKNGENKTDQEAEDLVVAQSEKAEVKDSVATSDNLEQKEASLADSDGKPSSLSQPNEALETGASFLGSNSALETKKPSGKWKKVLLIASLAVIVLAVAGAGVFYFLFERGPKTYTFKDANGDNVEVTLEEIKSTLLTDKFYPGTSVNGVEISGKTKEEALAAINKSTADKEDKVALSFEVGEEVFDLDGASVPLKNNAETVIDEAFKVARPEDTSDNDTLVKYYQEYLDLAKAKKDFPLEFKPDTTSLSGAIHNLLDGLQTEAEDAKVESFDVERLAFNILESKVGRKLDIDKAIEDAEKLLAEGKLQGTVSVQTEVTEPKVSKEFLESNLTLISSTTTETTGDENRNTNIRLIAEAINGLVLQPGESFDFNSYIGQRTAAKGYKEAGGIFDGALRQELGGGICQTNTTLFHSVVKADLQVNKRQAHSWPSSYVATGTDATVSWGGPDFSFANNTEYPVAIHAYYANRKITVEIYGRPIPDGKKIEFVGVVTGTSGSGAPEYVADPSAPAGSRVSVRPPHGYISAVSYKVYYKDGVEVERVKAFTTVYGAIREKIMVGVRGADGSVYQMDPATGAVNIPAPPPTEPVPTDPVPTETAPPTDPAPTTTAATQAPTQASTTPPTSSDTTPVAPAEGGT